MNRFRAIAILPLLFISMAVLSSCVSSSVPQPGAPNITTTQAQIATPTSVGATYAGTTMSTSGGTTPLSYSISSGGLPTGLTLARDGVISGTAKAAGTFLFVVEVTDAHNPPRTAMSPQFMITVTTPIPPVVQCPGTLSGSTCQLGTFALGATVNVTFTAMGTGPFNWTLPVLPPQQLSITSSTGVLNGTATQPGANQSFAVAVTDVAGQPSPSLTCTITISPATSPLAISVPGNPPAGVVGVQWDGVGFQPSATGGLPPYTWGVSGTLPTGLMINPSTGLISGIPTLASAAPYTFQIEVADFEVPQMTKFAPASSVFSVTITSNITVAITNPISTIQIGATPVTLNATVANDASPGGGVNWLLQSGTPLEPCSGSTCGTLTQLGSPSFSATYTPPTAVGAAPNNTPTITATAANDASKVASDPFTITSSITVTITNPITTIDANAAPVTVNATVTGDTSPPGGVNWTLQSGTPLSSCAGPGTNNCGTLKAVGSPSLSATYTPPTTQPTGANDTPTITATAVDDPSKSASNMFTINAAGAACGTGRESEMAGSFAYLMKGFDANGAVAIAGSVHADGTGKITEGVEDINRAGTGPQTNVPIVPGGSSYTLGADGRGCMTVATAAGPTTFRFSLDAFNSGAPTKGNIIEFDDNTGNGTRGAGIIRAQDPTSFANSKFANGFAFGLSGFGSSGEHVALAGTLTADGKGNVTGGNFDRNDAGNLTANSSKLAGTYNIPPGSTTGRGTMSATLNGTPFTFAVYMVSSNEAILAGVDQISETNQLTSGEAIASVGPFSNTTLAGSHLLRTNALSQSGSNAGSRATIGVLAFDGNTAGGVTGTLFDDEAGRNSTTTILHGAATYAVDSSTGRITFTGLGTDSPVGYAVQSGSGITAFLVGTDDGAADGALEFQTKGSSNFKSSTFTGAYSFGTDENLDYATTNESHSASVDSKTTTVAGASDTSQPRTNGLLPNQSFSNAFVFNSEGFGTLGTNPAVTNGTVIFFINEDGGNTHPRITVAEKQ